MEDSIEAIDETSGGLSMSNVENNGSAMSPPMSRSNTLPGSLNKLSNFKQTRSFRSLSLIRAKSVQILKSYRITNDTHTANLSNILSGLYAMLLVVIGASLPIAKVFAADISISALEGFYIYLFLVSILFILFVYAFIVHQWKYLEKFSNHLKECWPKCSKIKLIEIPPSSPEVLNISTSEKGYLRESDILDSQPMLCPADEISNFSGSTKKYGKFSLAPYSKSESFYLRLGAVAFGIGTVIHSGLEFGQFLELAKIPQCGVETIMIVRPVIQLIFTFVQLYFIFLNSKLCIHNSCTLARFGTMHLIATNLCIWLRVITIETVREIHKFLPETIEDIGFNEAIGLPDSDFIIPPPKDEHSGLRNFSRYDQQHHLHKRASSHSDGHGHGNVISSSVGHILNASMLDETSCGEDSVMKNLLDSCSAYLYPCAIEYCLISAAICFMIWNNIGKPTSNCKSPMSPLEDRSLMFQKRNVVSVDCSGANRGLFGGIFIFVLTVISIIIFFIYIDRAEFIETAVLVEHISQLILYTLALMAVILAAFRFRDMKFHYKRERQLDETLLVLSLTGVYMFRIFSSIAGQYAANPSSGSLVLATNIVITFQATVQTVFILNGLRRSARTQKQETRKPGREFVTFLLICNISIWATNTFEVLRSDANPVAMSFFGTIPWSIITHIATPLTIFHQFHATVCLSTIWKTAFKIKTS